MILVEQNAKVMAEEALKQGYAKVEVLRILFKPFGECKEGRFSRPSKMTQLCLRISPPGISLSSARAALPPRRS
jgi:hypothetical protein